MTPTEIRTALETLKNTILAWAVTSPHSEPAAYDRYRSRAIEQSGALLSALPGETAPDGDKAEWFRKGWEAGHAAAGDTGLAPPRALVEVVREWQAANLEWFLAGSPPPPEAMPAILAGDLLVDARGAHYSTPVAIHEIKRNCIVIWRRGSR